MAIVLKTDRLKASILKDDYKEYVQWAWPIVVAEPLIWNWHMDEICQRLQDKVLRRIKYMPCLNDLLINICPGSSKSLLSSVMLNGWAWAIDPTLKFICASFAHDLAQDLSRKSRMIVKSPQYQKLFPHVEIASDQDTKSLFSTTKMGYRYAVGVGGNVLGRHADVILLDDIIDPKIASSEVELEKANRWVSEEISGRKTNKETTVTILIMQRLHQGDPAGKMEERGHTDVLRLPACDDFPIHPPQLKKKYIKGLMDPKRITRQFLHKIQQESDYTYSGQYGQSPVPPGGGTFKIDLFRRDWENAPECTRFCRAWDKAGSMGRGSAFTVGVLMGVDNDNRFAILDVVRFKLDSFNRDKYIVEVAKQDGDNVIIAFEQEGGSGGKQSLDISLRDLAKYRLEWFKPTASKEDRAGRYSGQVNGSNMWIKPGHWNKQFIEEHKFFPMGTYKDQVDAAAMAFKVLTANTNIRIGGWTPSSKFSTSKEINKPRLLSLPNMELHSSKYLQIRPSNIFRIDPKELPSWIQYQ